MISQSAQYAVRAVMHLGREGAWRTAEDVWRATGIPPGYLSKILNGLTRAGILQSQRGTNGGFRLARPPAELTALAIVASLEPEPAAGSCRQCHATGPEPDCAVNRLLLASDAAARRILADATIAHLLAGCTPADRRSPPETGG